MNDVFVHRTLVFTLLLVGPYYVGYPHQSSYTVLSALAYFPLGFNSSFLLL